MMVPLYFLHGEPDDTLSRIAEDGVRYIASRTPEDRADEPEVEVTSTASSGPDPIVWVGPKYMSERPQFLKALGELPYQLKPERCRRMPEHWVSRQVIIYLAGVVTGAGIVALVLWMGL